MSPRVVGVVQARMGSQRLPGKVLAPIGDRSVVAWLLTSLQGVTALDDLILAVPEGDDQLVAEARRLGVSTICGDENDVLSRFGLAAEVTRADAVVRATADCPFLDPAVVAQAVDRYRQDPCDYLTAEGWPIGLGDVELIERSALDAAVTDATLPRHREHVGPFFLDQADRFVVQRLNAPEAVRRPELRVCIDQAEDLAAVRALYERLGRPPSVPPAATVVAALDANPDIVALNHAVQQRS